MPLPAGLPRLLSSRDPFPPVTEVTPGDAIALLTPEVTAKRLAEAYRRGYFPWPPRILGWMPWWSPDPRAVLFPAAFRLGRSLRRFLRECRWQLSHDRAFAAVLRGCAAPRPGREQTWLDAELRALYLRLHEEGLAHSVEVWDGERLVGGLFGVVVGALFSGDSMFSAESNASKLALLYLCRKLAASQAALIDCQVQSEHLARLGAVLIPRPDFLARLAAAAGAADPLRPPCPEPLPAAALLTA
jgi:leucyl/phenylalanyl-tRNA--protein transferase